jgi:serine/threonine-protein kinase
MQERGISDGVNLRVIVDPNQPHLPVGKCREAGRWLEIDEASYKYGPRAGCVATFGDGRLESVLTSDTFGLPKGTRLYGRMWTGGDEVVGRYTRAVVPADIEYRAEGSERDFPVCIALGLNGGVEKLPGSKPGAVIIWAESPVHAIYGQWP